MTSLYSLSAEYQRIIAQDEFTEEDLELIDKLHDTIEDRAIYYAITLSELKSKLHATKEAIKVAQEKRERTEKKIERLEKYVLDCMINNGIEKIDKHPLFDVTVKHNPVSVEDYDAQFIPNEYWVAKETLSLDKKRIKEDIEQNGLVIPGVRLVRKIVLKIE